MREPIWKRRRAVPYIWETGALDASLEALLQEYTESVGGAIGGAPAELVQGASHKAAEHALTAAE